MYYIMNLHILNSGVQDNEVVYTLICIKVFNNVVTMLWEQNNIIDHFLKWNGTSYWKYIQKHAYISCQHR